MFILPISPIEKKLTYLIASSGTNLILDKMMIVVSNPYRWLLPSMAFALVLIYLNWSAGIKSLLLGGMAAGIADSINTRIIKKKTDRIRPGKQYDDIKSLGSMNRGRKSFPSNHASNTMAFALGFSFFFPVATWFLVPLSFLVGYSRIYCGAHFPLDVLVGWTHGALWVFILLTIATILFL